MTEPLENFDVDKYRRRLKVIGIALVAAVVILGAAVGGSFLFTEGVSTRVTRIEQGPCSKDPNSNKCQTVVKQFTKAEDPSVACIIVRKAGLECRLPSHDRHAPSGSTRGSHDGANTSPAQGSAGTPDASAGSSSPTTGPESPAPTVPSPDGTAGGGTHTSPGGNGSPPDEPPGGGGNPPPDEPPSGPTGPSGVVGELCDTLHNPPPVCAGQSPVQLPPLP